MTVARQLVEALYAVDQRLILREHRGQLYRWNGTCWPECDPRTVRSSAYQWLEDASYFSPKEGPVPFSPTSHKINDVLDALRAIVLLERNVEAPCWLDGTTHPPATEITPMANGLLHVPTRTLYLHTPSFYSHHCLDFEYLAKCGPPERWLQFLHELWPDDQPSIDTLQEWFGYVLSGDTSLQKMFLLVGPKRAGKGTIGRVLAGLLGRHNVAAPSLAAFAANFGLALLIGRPLALLSDARLSARSDSTAVVEKLLKISGEDPIQIDRKYREQWSGRLPTRILILTNEVPRLADSSGALASRFVVLLLRRSFLGRENPQLTQQLLTEAPSIFRWALEGLDRLNGRGHFLVPDSSQDVIRQLEDLASPIRAFVNARCVVTQDRQVSVERLWKAWERWCKEQGYHPGKRAIFCRDLLAAVPTIRHRKPRVDGQRVHSYEGLTLRDE